jgi:hypothetical protein
MILKQLLLMALGLILLRCAALPVVSKRPDQHIPANLTEANSQLDQVLMPKAKAKFGQLNPLDLLDVRQLYVLDEWGIGEWGVDRSREDSPLVGYLDTFVNNKQESWGYQGWQARRYLVLLSYLRHLQRQPFDLAYEAGRVDQQGDSVAVAEAKRRQQDQAVDSLDGIFIPRNLPESATELDRLLADSVKQRIRQLRARGELEDLTPSLGVWLCSRWGLYTGSRLELHLRQLGHDTSGGMADAILAAYGDYLNGKEVIESAYQAPKHNYGPPVPPPPPPADLSPSRPGNDYSVRYRHFLRTGRIADFEVIPSNKL